ncbi:hypothetical protein [Xenorhabdus khoisanae]|uniref:hypothetical protein n=1 Tax=Xenorhabdus khoisanae TaxID=880157 RepID=UPI000AB08802|nr:hypothetical protein [Xenorhabdus khoisanae]
MVNPTTSTSSQGKSQVLRAILSPIQGFAHTLYNQLIKLKYPEKRSLNRYGNPHIARLSPLVIANIIKGLGLIPAPYRNIATLQIRSLV